MKRRAKKLRRKQPRRMTPPLVLRDRETGERHIVEVDDQTVTNATLETTRATALLILGPGLRVSVGSRCINKRRFPVLRIFPQGWTAPPNESGKAFREISAQ